jgi:hypothetical protein
VYALASWNAWDRDILPAGTVNGLFERYMWWTLEAGIQAELYRHESNLLAFELGVLLTRDGTIMIDLVDEGFGENTLNLADSQGFSTAVFYELGLAGTNRLRFGLSYRDWQFGRSNTLPVSDGTRTIYITEPDSRSKYTTFSIAYVYTFR